MPGRQRKGWEQLSPSYRKRLGRAGVSQRDYEQGKSLARARGHSRTPERPSQAYRNPTRYREYVTKHSLQTPGVVDQTLADALLERIYQASDSEARGSLRRLLERQPAAMKVYLAQQLGINHSIPGYDRLPLNYQVRMGELWLRAFMTHARAASEPALAGERYILKGGPREVAGIIKEAKDAGLLDDVPSSHDFWSAFKSSYHQFFTGHALPGV